MDIKIIKKNEIQPQIWEGGKTFQYFIFPEQSSYTDRNFDFRISSATIEKVPSAFTRFSGYKRFLVMLDEDLSIEKNGKREYYLEHEVFDFDSSDEIQSFSLGSDFNLMVKKQHQKSSVLVAKTFISTSDFIFVFALVGTRISVDNQPFALETGNLLLVKNNSRESIILRSETPVIFGEIHI